MKTRPTTLEILESIQAPLHQTAMHTEQSQRINVLFQDMVILGRISVVAIVEAMIAQPQLMTLTAVIQVTLRSLMLEELGQLHTGSMPVKNQVNNNKNLFNIINIFYNFIYLLFHKFLNFKFLINK